MALDASLADLDALGLDGWVGIEKLATELGDAVVIGLMRHSLSQSVAQVREAARGTGVDTASEATDDDAPRPSRKRNKGRDI